MADRKNFSRYNMRCGIILRAPVSHGRIAEIKLPAQDPRFLVITGKDFAGSNSLNFFGTTAPLLAEDRILYKNQPVLVMFAPDYESAAIKLREVELKIVDDSTEDEGPAIPALDYSWGEFAPDDDERAKMKSVTSEFILDPVTGDSLTSYTVTAWMDGSNLHIETPSQYPQFVRETVERMTGYPRRNIVIHLVP